MRGSANGLRQNRLAFFPTYPLPYKIICGTLPLSGQIFLQHQRVDAIGIVARDGLHHAVAVALVKRQCGDVIHGGFQGYGAGSGAAQAIFCRSQEQRSDAGAAGRGDNVDSNDVSRIARVSYDESGNFIAGGECGGFFRVAGSDQGYSSAAAQVELEFLPGVGNSGRKAILVDAPERLKMLGLKVSDRERHAAIVASGSWSKFIM